MKKILVPVDFSTPSEWAVELAAGIAEKTSAEVTLLHVVEHPTQSFNVEGEVNHDLEWEDKVYTFKLIDRSKKQLSRIEEHLRNRGIAVRTDLRVGSPYVGIKTIITQRQVDMVVMGTAGHSKLEEVLVGSITEKVVRHAKCPVLTVHRRPASYDFKNIVYATSANESEKDFAQVVKDMQEIFGSNLHLVRINTPMNFKPDINVNAMMDLFAKRLHLKNYTINSFSDLSEEEGILHFASKIGADMIAMATHGRTGLAHVLAGSIAEDVVNHASKPVLTYVTQNSH